MLLIAARIARSKGAPENSDYRAAFEQRQVERNARNFAGREANDQVAALPGHIAQRYFRVGTADRIVNYIDAFASRQIFEALAQVLAGVVDAFISAMFA